MAGRNNSRQNPSSDIKTDFNSFSIFLCFFQNTLFLNFLKGVWIFCPKPAKNTPMIGIPMMAYAMQKPRPRVVDGEIWP